MQAENVTKGISLHIGLNAVDPVHYQGWIGKLNACEADAKDMQLIAKRKGFSTQSLLTAQATRKNVTDSITAAADKLSSGDIFFLSYSGHGGQLPDWNEDEDDQQDETLCLYDAEFVDDELYKLLGLFQPGVRILVFSDSCHSGTVVKQREIDRVTMDNSAIVYRAMPDDVLVNVYRANREFYDSILTDESLRDARNQVRASVLLLSGCQDNQLSRDGLFNGLFTGRLLRVWRDGSFTGDYKQFHKDIVKGMPMDQTPMYYKVGLENPDFEGQVPFTVAFP